MKVFSIFKSINGEINKNIQGSVATFIRFAGCNLWKKDKCCSYCDTRKVQNPDEGKEMSVADIIKEVIKLKCGYITITGGEPLYQNHNDLWDLCVHLSDTGHTVSIETNGTIDIPFRTDNVHWVVDWKLPSSGVNKLMKLKRLSPLIYDQPIIKFVISNEEDYLEAKRVVKRISNSITGYGYMMPLFAFSPVFPLFSGKKLTEWVIRDGLNVIINLQLHKILNLVEDNSSGL